MITVDNYFLLMLYFQYQLFNGVIKWKLKTDLIISICFYFTLAINLASVTFGVAFLVVKCCQVNIPEEFMNHW